MTGDGTAVPGSVALFATCLADTAAPGPAQAAVEVLEAMGVRARAPSAQTCCGQAGFNAGHPAAARRLARHWIAVFEGYDAVVTPSGSCAAMVRHHYPRLLTGAWRERAARVAARTFELSQFVAAFGQGLPLRLERTVAYHDSCHMLRSLEEREAPRVVLARIAGLELRELDDVAACCGFGGTFSTSLPAVSVAMADAKIAAAAETGADLLVSADAGCLLHLTARAQAAGCRIRACHLAELLRDALKGTA